MRRPRWHWLALSPWLAGLVTSCVLLGWPAAASAQVRHRHVNMSAAETAGQAVMDTALRHEGSGGQDRRAQIRYYTAVERRLARQEAAQDRRQAARAAARAAALASAAAKQAHAPKPAPQAAPAATSPPQAGSYSGAPGSFQACVIRAESGGNPAAYNPSSGAGGLYQFLPSTWASLGFAAQYPGGAQTAPVSVQNAAFEKLYAEAGTSPWAPYDGC